MQRLGQLKSVEPWERAEGSPSPLGATWIESEKAWNFALFSRHATGIKEARNGVDSGDHWRVQLGLVYSLFD